MRTILFILSLLIVTCSHAQEGEEAGKAGTGSPQENPTRTRKKSSRPVLPKHSISAGGLLTTMNNSIGGYLEYQYYVDDQISYVIRPGFTGLDNPDSTNIVTLIGIDYKLGVLRRPLRDRFFNGQVHAGFFPASIEYLSIDATGAEEAKTRLGWSPMGVLGYTLIFSNTISLDLFAGFGMSFRLAGKAGAGLDPTFMTGASIGYRIRK